MGNKSYLTLTGILLLSILFWSACNNPGSSLEESVAPYLELQAIDGASNVTMVVNRGETRGLDSYFAFDIRSIEPNGTVRKGIKEGWCLEWNKPMRQNNDVHSGVQLFNTSGSNTWKPANYLMNIKDDLKADDPDLTYKEIQVALWSLIEEPRFDLDKVMQNGQIPSRLMENGQPNFSVSKVKSIVDRVRSEISNFEVKPGSPFLAFYNTGDGQQNGGHEVTCDGFRTQTQGGWGSTAAGNNPGSYRDANFNKAFPDGLTVGGEFTLNLTSASAVQAFLPSGGQSNALSQNYTDPTQSLGAFTGNLVALSLSIGFDDCTDCDAFGNNDLSMKDLIFQNGDFAGMTVEEVLAEANRVLGGGDIEDYSINQLNNVIDAVNNNYVDGNPAADLNLLDCTLPDTVL